MDLDPSIALIADDDTAIRDGLATLFRDRGYGSVTCSDPEAAVEAYAHYRPAVAVVDVCFQSPFGFEGLSLIERLRAMEPRATIIAMSGRRTDGLAEYALAQGASRFLPKPFGWDEIALHFPALEPSEAEINVIRIPPIDEILSGLVEMHFQPIVGLQEMNRTIGWEALARVAADPPFRSPAALLRYARRVGRIADANRVCVGQALRTGGCLTTSGLLFINLDPELLEAGGACAEAIASEFQLERIDPRAVVFEVTERAELSDNSVEALIALRQLGAGIALDDVGAGLTHFSQLGSILPTFMKIAVELGGSIADNAMNRMIVAHLVDVAHAVGCRVVIEGLETEEAVSAARDLGADCAQGFRVGRPAPLAALREQLVDRPK